MDCSEVLEQLGDFLDQEARADLCREIEAHLGKCRDCKLEVDTLRKTIVLYQADSAKSMELPIKYSERLGAVLAHEYRRGSVSEPD